MLIVALCLAAVARAAAAGQAPGAIEGTVADSGGGMLPGVLVEITRPGTRVVVASTTTDVKGSYRVQSLRGGKYVVRFALAGFSKAEVPVDVEAGATVTAPVALQIERLNETVQVVAPELALDAATSTQTASFSNEVLTELPTASRNYTHVIVAEAGVNAPLPDRTGQGSEHRHQSRHAGRRRLAVAQPERQRRAAHQQRAAAQRHRRHQHAQCAAAGSATTW